MLAAEQIDQWSHGSLYTYSIFSLLHIIFLAHLVRLKSKAKFSLLADVYIFHRPRLVRFFK